MDYYVGTTGIPITFVVQDAQAQEKSLAGATVEAIFVFANGDRVVQSCSLVSGGTTGRFSWPNDDASFFTDARAGKFSVQGAFTLGGVRTFLHAASGVVRKTL
jgi:hypothetical protein